MLFKWKIYMLCWKCNRYESSVDKNWIILRLILLNWNSFVSAGKLALIALLNKVPQVPRVPKWSSSWVLECPSAQVSWVPVCPWCALGMPLGWPIFSLWVPQCPSALRMPLECLWSAQFPFECSTSKKKSATLQQMDSLKTFQNTNFTWHFLLSPFLEIRFVSFASFCQLNVIIQKDFENFP